ncbi:MAG: hypothetical protein A2135_01375 [Actinobacteria bacterium RBG_16_67_15]|nr:MAG: hypothetical protein A2135_01375 [Actinobacteria bacterium RBG_16_67_15]
MVSGQVIIARHDGAMYAVGIETQTLVWSIYLGNDAGTFPAGFETAGFCEWAPQTGYSVLASPAVAANGYIVVGTLEGYLVAISDRSWG